MSKDNKSLGNMAIALSFLACLILLFDAGPAITSQEQQTETDQINIDELLQQAQDEYQSKNYSAALEITDHILQNNKSNNSALNLKGHALGKLGRIDEAVIVFQNAVMQDPLSDSNWGNLGWHQILAGKFLEARNSIENALELEPKSYHSNINLGHTYLMMGDLQEAQEYYLKAITLEDHEHKHCRGPIADFEFFIQRDWQTALSKEGKNWFLKTALERLAFDEIQYPDDAFWQNGKAAFDAAEFNKAALLFKQSAIGKSGSSLAGRLSWEAKSYEMGCHLEKSRSTYQQILKIREQFPGEDQSDLFRTLFNYAVLSLSLGDQDQAISLTLKMIEITPDPL